MAEHLQLVGTHTVGKLLVISMTGMPLVLAVRGLAKCQIKLSEHITNVVLAGIGGWIIVRRHSTLRDQIYFLPLCAIFQGLYYFSVTGKQK